MCAKRSCLTRQLLNLPKPDLKEVIIPNWAPSKLIEAREDMDKFYDTHRQFLTTALRGLATPDPLVDKAGEAKLNMFLSGLGLARQMVQHHPLKV